MAVTAPAEAIARVLDAVGPHTVEYIHNGFARIGYWTDPSQVDSIIDKATRMVEDIRIRREICFVYPSRNPAFAAFQNA